MNTDHQTWLEAPEQAQYAADSAEEEMAEQIRANLFDDHFDILMDAFGDCVEKNQIEFFATQPPARSVDDSEGVSWDYVQALSVWNRALWNMIEKKIQEEIPQAIADARAESRIAELESQQE